MIDVLLKYLHGFPLILGHFKIFYFSIQLLICS